MPKKIIAILIVVIAVIGAFEFLGLGTYTKVMNEDVDVDVTVKPLDSDEFNELSEKRQRLIKYFLTEKCDYTIEEMPEDFETREYTGDIRYVVTIDGTEYIYKPALDLAAKPWNLTYKFSYLEGMDKVIMNLIIS